MKHIIRRSFMSILTPYFLVVMLITLSLFPSILVSTKVYATESATPEEGESQEPVVQSDATEGWPQGPEVTAEAAIVMDAATGAILYEKNINGKFYPASITKVLTTLLVLENASLDEMVTFSETAIYSIEADSSHIGIQPGEKLTVRQCLYAIMLASANEVSNGVAEHVGGSIEEFANMMNEKAAQLGCQQTHFTNPHGLHNDDHYTSAYDMGLIVRAALDNPQFLQFAGALEYMIPVTNLVAEPRSFINHHKMLYPDTGYTYEHCLAGKTGFTEHAWNTLVTVAEKDGVELICVTLRVNGAYVSYEETMSLLEYGFSNFDPQNIMQNDQLFKEIHALDLVSGINDSDHTTGLLKIPDDAALILPKGASFADLTKSITLDSEDSSYSPFISYFYNGRFLGSIPFTFTKQVDLQTQTQSNEYINAPKPEAPSTASGQEGLRASASVVSDSDVTRDAITETQNLSTAQLESSEMEETHTQSNVQPTSGAFGVIIEKLTANPLLVILLIIALLLLIILVFILTMLIKHLKKRKSRQEKLRQRMEDDNYLDL